jgi:hypothetical protein
MSPDPDALSATTTSDAPLNNQALHRKKTRDEIATLAAQAAATAVYFNTLITDHLHARKPGAGRQRHLPDGMMSIGRDQQIEALAGSIEFVPDSYEIVPAGSPMQGAVRLEKPDRLLKFLQIVSIAAAFFSEQTPLCGVNLLK